MAVRETGGAESSELQKSKEVESLSAVAVAERDHARRQRDNQTPTQPIG